MSVRDEAEERRLVEVLRPYQLAKLEKYRRKGGWGMCHPQWLLWRAQEELDELKAEFAESPEAIEKIANEAADVANFLAMLVDVLTRKGQA